MPTRCYEKIATDQKHRSRNELLTTTDDPREVERCYALGCSVYVTKPVEYEQFREAVRQLGLFLQLVELPSQDAVGSG